MQNDHLSRPNRSLIWLLTLCLFALFASRVTRLLSFPMDNDELWSIWQTFGPLDKVLGWVPYDWPPLHFVSVWAWQSLVSAQPFTVRLLSVFAFLLGAACMYRAARFITRNPVAGVVAMLTYGAFGFTVYMSMVVRGYIFVYSLTPLLLWQTLHYFQRSTPRRTIFLGVIMAAMLYMHLTALFPIALIGLYTFLQSPGRILRWIAPGLVTIVLTLPLILQRVSVTVSRMQVVAQIPSTPFEAGLSGWYVDYFGAWAAPGLIVLFIAALLTILRWRRAGVALIVWGLFPAGMLALNARFGFFSLRHLAYVGVGLALLIGMGLSALKRPGLIGAGVVLLVVTLLPFPTEKYLLSDTKPTLEVFGWLRDHWQAGDVVYIDPTTKPVAPETWDYFARVYFPKGLPIVENPTGYRRVWYATVDGWNLPENRAKVQTGRVAREFVGPWNFLVRLYEAPPDPKGILFENGLRFLGMETRNSATPGYLAFHENETIRLRVWWTVDTPVSADYSLTTQLLDKSGALIAQSPDRAGSADVPKETSRWQPGTLYSEDWTLTLPENLYTAGDFATKDYALYLTVYQWWDGKRIAAPGVTDSTLLPIGTVHVTAW